MIHIADIVESHLRPMVNQDILLCEEDEGQFIRPQGFYRGTFYRDGEAIAKIHSLEISGIFGKQIRQYIVVCRDEADYANMCKECMKVAKKNGVLVEVATISKLLAGMLP